MFPSLSRTVFIYAYCPDIITDSVSFHSQKYPGLDGLYGRPIIRSYIIFLPRILHYPLSPHLVLLSPLHPTATASLLFFKPSGSLLPCTSSFHDGWSTLTQIVEQFAPSSKFLDNCHLVFSATHSKINILFPFFLFSFPILLFSLALISHTMYLLI